MKQCILLPACFVDTPVPDRAEGGTSSSGTAAPAAHEGAASSKHGVVTALAVAVVGADWSVALYIARLALEAPPPGVQLPQLAPLLLPALRAAMTEFEQQWGALERCGLFPS